MFLSFPKTNTSNVLPVVLLIKKNNLNHLNLVLIISFSYKSRKTGKVLLVIMYVLVNTLRGDQVIVWVEVDVTLINLGVQVKPITDSVCGNNVVHTAKVLMSLC